MDPALKQRLLGAAVLVALAIIFLPMLFGGPSAPPPSDALPMDVPAAPDRPLQTREIPLTLPQTPAAMPASPTDTGDSGRLATVDVASSAPREVPEDDAPPPAAATPVAATPKPPEAKRPAAPVAARPQPAAPVASTPSTAATASTPAGGRYVVNLGSYGNAASAKTLLDGLTRGGVKAYAETIQLDGKPATRLRAGPFASKLEAESAAAAAKRVRADLPATVIALEAGDAAPARAAPAVPGGFVVQVGAFREEADANALRARLRNAGFAAFVERVNLKDGTWWRVRVGPELHRAKAEATQASLRQRFQLDGQVLTHP